MITGATLAKQAISILGYLNNNILPSENTGQDDILKALYSMHKLYPACAVITCPVQHNNFFYISDNCELIFGYSPQYMGEHFKTIANYFSEVHEADMGDLKDCMNVFESFLQHEQPEDYHTFRTILHYRFLNAAGKYIYLQDEKATLITEGGKMINFSLIRVMPDEAVFSGVKIEIYKLGNRLEKMLEHKPSAVRNKLSKRENDLVGLIKKGLTTKEIAWQLSISHNTVRNIKSKMFEKYSVNNVVELLNMTG